MSEPQTAQGRLYTLSEISQRTGISMPTLQRYKKLYQSRIPAEGKGRKQRYPESALPVFEELRNENLGRRGRPRKDPNAPRPERPARGRAGAKAAGGAKRAGGRKAASKRPAPAPAAAAGRGGRGRKTVAAGQRGGSGGLLTLTQVSEQTGISYPTLVRYVRLHSDRLPSEGKGRARRFHPEAVEVFRQLREESGRGGRKPGAETGRAGARGAAAGRTGARGAAGRGRGEEGVLHQRLRALEKSQENLEKRFKGFVQSLQKLFR